MLCIVEIKGVDYNQLPAHEPNLRLYDTWWISGELYSLLTARKVKWYVLYAPSFYGKPQFILSIHSKRQSSTILHTVFCFVLLLIPINIRLEL